MHKLSARHRVTILRPLAMACGMALGGCATAEAPDEALLTGDSVVAFLVRSSQR